MDDVRLCVACGSERWDAAETWGIYQLALCRECGVTFTRNPDYRRARYIAAYDGSSGDLPVPRHHVHVYSAPELRLRYEALAFPKFLPRPRLTPAELHALGWLGRHAPRHARIIDCGCGTGRFLDMLSRAGFEAVGVELSATLVGLLKRRGLRAVVGAAPEFPWDGPDPFAVAFFEVLEHLPNPGTVIAPLMARFPRTHVLASVPSAFRASRGRGGTHTLSDYPPNHFIRWTALGLERFFTSMGYSNVSLFSPPPVGSEMLPGIGQLLLGGRRALARRTHPAPGAPTDSACVPPRTRLAATGALWFLRGLQAATDVIGRPLAVRAERKGASAGSLLAIATP